MTTFDELAQRYINTWNETDPTARDARNSSRQRLAVSARLNTDRTAVVPQGMGL